MNIISGRFMESLGYDVELTYVKRESWDAKNKME